MQHLRSDRSGKGPHIARNPRTGTSRVRRGGPRSTLCATEAIADNTPIFTLRALALPASWPHGEQGPLGRPLTHAATGDNCRWVCSRCDECNARRLSAISTQAIAPGELLRGPTPPHTCQLQKREAPDLRISFDGGARHSTPEVSLDQEGPKAVGAGAILWGSGRSLGGLGGSWVALGGLLGRSWGGLGASWAVLKR